MLGPLEGFTVGVTADRRAAEQADLLARRGARVVHGPSVRTLALDDDEALTAATDAVLGAPPDVVVLLTGVGCRGWLSAAESTGADGALREVLRGASVIARGPKAAGAAVAGGVEVEWQATSETSDEIRTTLVAAGVAGRRVAVQRDGAGTARLAEALAAAGADVVDVPVYRWTSPVDPEAALRLVEAACDRRLDVVTFTSSPAVDNLFALAHEAGLAAGLVSALQGPVVAACVGPVCAATARRHGIDDVVQPSRARLGAMVQAIVRRFEGTALAFRLGGVEVRLQGGTAVVGDRTVPLSPRERDVLAALAARPGRVLAKDELLARLWGGGDPHTVEVTVGRLRRRLGPPGRAIRSVTRRGYVLDATG